MALRDSICQNKPAGPGILEIKPTSNGIDIYDFSSKIKIFVQFAFHGFKIDFFQIDSASGNKFFLKSTFSINLKSAIRQLIRLNFAIVF